MLDLKTCLLFSTHRMQEMPRINKEAMVRVTTCCARITDDTSKARHMVRQICPPDNQQPGAFPSEVIHSFTQQLVLEATVM